MKIIGNKMYDVCASCGGIICLNKTFFGSLHFCTTTDERSRYSHEIEMKYQLNKKALYNTQ